MKYFYLNQDSRFTTSPEILNWYPQYDTRYIFERKIEKIPARGILDIRKSPYTFFTDIITVPFLLVTEKVQEVLSFYDQSIQFRQVVLLDPDNMLTEVYYIPFLRQFDCLSDKSELNLDRSVIKHGILKKSKLPDRSIFFLKGVKKFYYLIRLDLAESLLRRGARGLYFTPIQIE